MSFDTLGDLKPQQGVWFMISGGYHLVGLLVASLIVSVWE
jgi:hypothetical protein